MVLSGMSRAWMVSACAVTLGLLLPGGAVAQDQQQYETPLYSTQGSTPLNKNYGMPAFGTPGSEVPEPGKATTAKQAEPSVPNFFHNSNDKAATAKQAQPTVPNFFDSSGDIPLPKSDTSTSADAGMETPLYTTSQGSSITDPASSATAIGSSALGSGFTTEDTTAPRGGSGDSTSSAGAGQ